jgi:hypothetical protein
VALGDVRVLARPQRRQVHRTLERHDRLPDLGHRHKTRSNTPYAGARRVARLLGNAVLLTHDGYSHISINDPSACVMRATSAYLVNRVTPRRGTVCPSDHQPFDPDYGPPLE